MQSTRKRDAQWQRRKRQYPANGNRHRHAEQVTDQAKHQRHDQSAYRVDGIEQAERARQAVRVDEIADGGVEDGGGAVQRDAEQRQ